MDLANLKYWQNTLIINKTSLQNQSNRQKLYIFLYFVRVNTIYYILNCIIIQKRIKLLKNIKFQVFGLKNIMYNTKIYFKYLIFVLLIINNYLCF